MKICITGATGFIAARLVERLAAGHELHLLSRRAERRTGQDDGIRWWQADLARDDVALEPFVDGADVLFHCAGEVRRIEAMRPLHVDGTRRLVRAASGRVRRWVQLSSVGVYGPCSSGVVREDRSPAPLGEYETTKAMSDELVRTAAAQGAFSCTLLRPSIVFGAGMPNRSLYQLISMIDRRLFFYIGRPGACAPYVHVDNVVEALVLCGARPEAGGRIYNLSDDRDIERFVTCIADALGRRPPVVRIPGLLARAIAATLGSLPGFPLTTSRVRAVTSRAHYPIDAIASELGYRHRTTVEEGLARLVEDWRQSR